MKKIDPLAALAMPRKKKTPAAAPNPAATKPGQKPVPPIPQAKY